MSDVDWGNLAKAYFEEMPHPRGHGLKVKEVLPAVKLASMMRFGGHASLHEAAMFWREFAPGGVPMMPFQDFEHALDRIAPLSYVYHGRPPSLREIAQLNDRAPHEVRRYFSDLPHRTYPDVSAGEMVGAMQAARPWALEHLGREPVVKEARYLHHSKESPAVYYQRVAAAQNTQPQEQQANGIQNQVGADAGGRGVGTAGRQAPGQRT